MDKNIFTQFMSFRIGSIARDLARHFNSEFSQFGITIGQALVLFYLLDNDGSSLKDIANTLELDSPSISRLVDRLIKEEFIIRKEDELDRRSIQIYLTDKGTELGKRVFPISFGFNDYLKEALGDEGFMMLGNYLNKIKQTLK